MDREVHSFDGKIQHTRKNGDVLDIFFTYNYSILNEADLDPQSLEWMAFKKGSDDEIDKLLFTIEEENLIEMGIDSYIEEIYSDLFDPLWS